MRCISEAGDTVCRPCARAAGLPTSPSSSGCSEAVGVSAVGPMPLLQRQPWAGAAGPTVGAGLIEAFDCHGSGFAAAYAQSTDATTKPKAVQGVDQRYQKTAAGDADGMTQRAGAVMHADALVRHVQFAHGDHRHYGEGIVDLEQMHL